MAAKDPVGSKLEKKSREAPPLREASSSVSRMMPTDLPAISQETPMTLRRQKEFHAAAVYVATAFARLDSVQRVVLFGSVAVPLRREMPRSRRLRRAGVSFHECKDVDLAVWVSHLGSLKDLQRARGRALTLLFDERRIGVAHHQVDVFLMGAGSDRYLGRLCNFGVCPKGKAECRVPGCGKALFLQQHENFEFDMGSLDAGKTVPLFDRRGASGAPTSARCSDGDIPL